MEIYSENIKISKYCFNFIGISILNKKWKLIRLCIFLILLTFPVINGGLLAAITMNTGNVKVFSTCIYVIFPNAMVLIKLLICMAMWTDFNALFDWIKDCFNQKYDEPQLNIIWNELCLECARYTNIYTRYYF